MYYTRGNTDTHDNGLGWDVYLDKYSGFVLFIFSKISKRRLDLETIGLEWS